jgi:hypothetical protein
MKNLTQLSVLLLSFLLLVGCKCCQNELCDDPTNKDCANYDPCSAKEKANFIALWLNTVDGEKPEYYPRLFVYRVPLPFQDTLAILPGPLFLICEEEHESYRWQIGLHESELTGQQVTLDFDTIYTGPITVRLITKDKPIHNCATDDGLDTIYKTFVLEKATPIIFSYFVQKDLFGSYVVQTYATRVLNAQ